MDEWRNWKHITKIDPDKKITPQNIKTIVETETDAIMVSGTAGITKEKVSRIVKMIKEYDVPIVLEPAHPKAMIYNRDINWIFVPTVFNTDNPRFINGYHKSWVKLHKDKIDWDRVVPEAYIILNPKCTAFKVTKCKLLDKESVVAAAKTAEMFFNIPIVYIEYSGKYGNPEIVKAVSESLKKAHLIYGGGIRTAKQAEEMRKWATIVVGNTIYEGGIGTFVSTMRGTLLRDMSSISLKLRKLRKIEEEQNGKKKKKKKKKKKRRSGRIKRFIRRRKKK